MNSRMFCDANAGYIQALQRKQFIYMGFDAQRGVQTTRICQKPNSSVHNIVRSGFQDHFLLPRATCRLDLKDIDIIRTGFTSALKKDVVGSE